MRYWSKSRQRSTQKFLSFTPREETRETLISLTGLVSPRSHFSVTASNFLPGTKFNHFPWPPLPNTDERPSWTGRKFLVGASELDYLGYGGNDSAWSDELTAMHEAEATSAHPIDIASRTLAIRSMKQVVKDPRATLLDIGSSSGFLIEELRKAFPRAAIIGSDYLASVVAHAAQRLKNTPFIQFDLRHCPLRDECIDGVTALNVLEHIDDDRTALQEIHRILRRGGIAHIEVPAAPSCYDIYDEVLLHHRRYRLHELTAIAEGLGFQTERATHLGFSLYPAFRLVKTLGRSRLRRLSPTEKKTIVAARIRYTAHSRVLSYLLSTENWLGKCVNYPFGIRAVVRLKKA
jgi:SAM-dependent methyltransferase